ncbi:MAG: alpha-1,2-fucosyltransferase [Ferruginibacter sp.]
MSLKNKVAKVYISFPKTGLGNMLLVWARGYVFARINNLPYITSSWWGLHYGALIRRERKSRMYFGYFIETPLWKQLAIKLNCIFGKVEDEPKIEIIELSKENDNEIYRFSKPSVNEDLFGVLRDHRQIVVAGINAMLTARIQKQLSAYQPPVIGIHIRRGDFKLGSQTTPIEFFIQGINSIRRVSGATVPVTIFTDAQPNELSALLELPHIYITEEKPDIVDILLLSKSKIMLLSRSSTFSYWAAFLSEAIVIRPSNDWQPFIKMHSDSSLYEEITLNIADNDSSDNLVRMLEKRELVLQQIIQ